MIVNDDIVERYFDIVQQKIKELISEDKEIKKDEIEKFNDEIFNQPIDMQDQIRQYIEHATEENLDIDNVAKTIYDKFKVQIKNNEFATTDVQDVPNKLLGERYHILTYKKFNENMKL